MRLKPSRLLVAALDLPTHPFSKPQSAGRRVPAAKDTQQPARPAPRSETPGKPNRNLRDLPRPPGPQDNQRRVSVQSTPRKVVPQASPPAGSAGPSNPNQPSRQPEPQTTGAQGETAGY